MFHGKCFFRTFNLVLRIVFAYASVLFSSPICTAEEREEHDLKNDPQWVTYEPHVEAAGNGKHIVLVSGDEEYRSEEMLPALAEILTKRHGFKCTVLFAVDPETGLINPKNTKNIPGLEALKTADLMILMTRFRNLPDDQMKHIDEYVMSGKPIIGLRTSTHAFKMAKNSKYAKYSYDSKSKEWPGGFGKNVMGETWISHHGKHKFESTRGILEATEHENPILRGIKDGDIWGPTDVYTVSFPMLETCHPLVRGQLLTGMKRTDPPIDGKKNDPMLPVAWTNAPKLPNGKTPKIFCTTMGCPEDFESAGFRRLLVNASYWCVGLEDKIKPDLNVDLYESFKATPYGFDGFKKNMKPSDYLLKKKPI